MAAIQEKTKSELASAYERMKNGIAKAKAESKQLAARGTTAGLTVGGGWAVGAARKRFGKNGKTLIPGTEVEGDLAVGVVLTLAGLVGAGDELAPQITGLGSGVLAGYAALAAAK